MLDDMARYRNLVTEATGGFDPQKILTYLNVGFYDEVHLNIPLKMDLQYAVLEDIFMHIDPDEDVINLGATVTRPLHRDSDQSHHHPLSDDNIDWDDLDHQVKAALINAGFSTNAVNSVEFMEADTYTAWYAADGILEEIRNIIETHDGFGLAIATKHGFDLNDPNNKSKKIVLIKWMLSTIKKHGAVPWSVKKVAEVLKKQGITWPELDAILMSANAT